MVLIEFVVLFTYFFNHILNDAQLILFNIKKDFVEKHVYNTQS